jgi:exopolyphosphatase/guanosine-5'-triphosphate,3'-diphosphate pyrophosphatase
MPRIGLAVGDQSLELRFDTAWLQANPLTVADLEREAGYARAVGYELRFS